MGHAVLVRGLRRRQLVVALERHSAARPREDRVRAPFGLVRDAAARLQAPAPLIGEQNLGAVVVERRRVPERKVGVGHGADPLRIGDVTDVEQEAIAAARTARQPDRRVDGNVVALCRASGGTLAAAICLGTAVHNVLQARP